MRLVIKNAAIEMFTQTQDNNKLCKTEIEIDAIFDRYSGLKNSQNFRLINSSSDLIRIKSQLSDMNESTSITSFYPYLDQVPTCDPYAKILMDKAYTSNISGCDQQIVLHELLKKPSFLYEVDLTPDKLPELIERNPLISYEVLLKLVHRIDDTAFYEVIVDMPLSLHSLEVMNRLCTTTVLPLEVVKLYIANCLSKCESGINCEGLQTRYVKLLCVFLQTILQNKIYAIEDIYFDILAFCVNFYQIKEAANLWCLIKRLEATETIDAAKAAVAAASSPSLAVSTETRSTTASGGASNKKGASSSNRKVKKSKSQKRIQRKVKKF